MSGHRWLVLPDETGDDALVDSSLWRNQDQNENHQDHELMIIHCITYAAEHLLKLGKQTVTIADLMAAAQKRHPGTVPRPPGCQCAPITLCPWKWRSYVVARTV